MPNYDSSILAKGQALLDAQFSAPEMRVGLSPAMDVLTKKRDIAIPDLTSLRTKEERPTEAYFNTRTLRTVTGSSRNFQHTGAIGDNAVITPTYSTYLDTFSYSMKRADNNVETMQQQITNEFANAFRNIYQGVEAAAIAWMDANKTQVFNVPNPRLISNANFAANNVLEVAAANQAEYFYYGSQALQQNNYFNRFDVIGDPIVGKIGAEQRAQGTANASNQQWQFGDTDFYAAPRLFDANYASGIGFWIPQGTVAVLDWIPRQNREGFGNLENATKDNPFFTTIVDPFFGLTMAVHIYKEGADSSATGGDAQDVVWQHEISVDLSFNAAPLSTANESTIHAIGIA